MVLLGCGLPLGHGVFLTGCASCQYLGPTGGFWGLCLGFHWEGGMVWRPMVRPGVCVSVRPPESLVLWPFFPKTMSDGEGGPGEGCQKVLHPLVNSRRCLHAVLKLYSQHLLSALLCLPPT